MVSLLGVLSFFSALAATSDALSCTQCISSSSTCSGNNVTCASGFTCGSTYIETVEAGTTTTLLNRTCTNLSRCSVTGSLSMTPGKIRMGITCCNSDNCTPSLPTLPAQGSNPNGRSCPSCISTTGCNTTSTIQCTGDENMCLVLITQIPGSVSKTFRGCTTNSLCDLSSQSQPVIMSNCTNGSPTTPSAHHIILTPPIVCLLLLIFLR
ncbi:phospholipase A2 inhibitor gamma subunit B-like [Engystomops pustulosus]|uniref:phospholipase A2 inhibitor gamma subunit B-like n=1 Tax=Engystomops pustulosus TaxID=76066 RepID=UPI003AFA70B8